MRWTIPNILTVARLVAVPFLPVAFLYFDRPWADWFALVLFVLAAITDYIDGYLARAWNMTSRFGAAMDPIADKALVMISLLVINGYAGLTPWILLPSALIMFREVFVSGLRETLGDRARALKVTNLAKWKTMAQMVAITLIFVKGVFEHHVELARAGGGAAAGLSRWADWTGGTGVALLWIAGVLTVVTGWDYFRKAFPMLKEAPHD